MTDRSIPISEVVEEDRFVVREWHDFFQGLNTDLVEKDSVIVGSGVFAGSGGVAVSIGSTLDGTTYYVMVQPTGGDPSDVGGISVTGKSVSSFTVINSGSDVTGSFDWILIDKN